MNLAMTKWIPWFIVPLIFFYIAGELPTLFPPFIGDKIASFVDFNNRLFTLELPSGELWNPTTGQFVVIFGVFILYVELFKSTQTSDVSIIDHSLSTIVFIGYFSFFLTKSWASNDVFLILSVMSFLDVIAGFTITIATARRDFMFGGG